MQEFINRVYNFIYTLYLTVNQSISDYSTSTIRTLYTEFLDKQIISGTLLNIGLTWRELFLFISTWFIIIFFIAFIFHVVYKIIGLFRI